ncbi:prolactin-releasing peptide receptor-like [Ptychodera flava]|uniref:prolactin-releasing peptide receptor-like n=1 Tax=Ptychodera flava TaxID=63121 RepID=UPI003969F25C
MEAMDDNFSLEDGNFTSYGNNTDGLSLDYKNVTKHPAFKGVFIFVYSIIIALGITGNTMVCMAIVRNKKLHNSTYIFIGNLSVSDAAVCLVCLPFTLANALNGIWSYGKVLCYIIRSLQPIAVFVSTLTLTAISIDRYMIVLYPFKKRLSMKLVALTLLAIWVLSISLAVPLIVNIKYVEFDVQIAGVHYKTIFCAESWEVSRNRKIYSTFVFILEYALPLFVISTAYYKVWEELQRQVRPGAVSVQKKRQEIMRKKRTNKMLGTVVVCFIALWLPFNTLMIYGDYHQKLSDYYWYDVVYHLCHVIAMSSTCINPFIYGGLDELFHKEFLKIIHCVVRSSRHSAVVTGKTGTNRETRQGTLTMAY